jgi:putative protein kinase ArgK-like GTPase of G3E family
MNYKRLFSKKQRKEWQKLLDEIKESNRRALERLIFYKENRHIDAFANSIITEEDKENSIISDYKEMLK